MAAVASPQVEPLILSHSDQVYRRLTNRNVIRATRRPYPNRSSPHIATSTDVASSTRTATTDSSDDEDLAPIKLSAEAQAILGEDNSNSQSSGRNLKCTGGLLQESGHGGQDIESALARKLPRNSISPNRDDGSPAPRVVRIASAARPTASTTIARDGSFMYKTFDKISEDVSREPHESRTPGSCLRTVRVNGSRSHTRSPPSALSGGNTAGSSNSSAQSSRVRTTASPENGEAKNSLD